MFFRPQIFCRVALLACLLFAGPGCATFRKWLPKRPPKAVKVEPHAPRQVGTVALVNEDARFVLIDTGSGAVPAKGEALKTFTDGVESGVVSVGDVRRRPFVVADISQGAPKKGDRVFQ